APTRRPDRSRRGERRLLGARFTCRPRGDHRAADRPAGADTPALAFSATGGRGTVRGLAPGSLTRRTADERGNRRAAWHTWSDGDGEGGAAASVREGVADGR